MMMIIIIIIITVSCEVLGVCNSTVEGFHYSGIWQHVTGSLVCDILRHCCGLVFKGQISNGNLKIEDEKNGH